MFYEYIDFAFIDNTTGYGIIILQTWIMKWIKLYNAY